MRILEKPKAMSDEEYAKFKEELAGLFEVPMLYGGEIKFVTLKYPRWKKWRDRIWNSLPVILLEMKLRDIVAWIKRMVYGYP